MHYQRVISLTPSITETIFALEAQQRLVGVTDACDYPPEVHTKPHVCSWYDPDLDRIRHLRPDLILGLQTAHDRVASLLENLGAQTVLFNPATVEETLADILGLAELLGRHQLGQTLVASLRIRLTVLDERVREISPARRSTIARVLDIDGDEMIVAGPRSFQYDVIARAGGVNVTSAIDAAYPKIGRAHV